MRLPSQSKEPLGEGRLLLLSSFSNKQKRTTVDMAHERNRFVAALAEKILVIHATPGGKLENMCREVITWGKPLLTLQNEANANLFSLGAQPMLIDR